jgi:hypothetical protein
MSTSGSPDQGARAEQAQIRLEMAQAQARREARRAQKLIDAFVAEAEARGIKPEPLRAQLFGGGTAKTDKAGWYIKADRSVAIGTDGGYYALSVPGGWRQRISGVRLQPSQPSLTVGRGGRDGETGELAWFLDVALNGYPPTGRS